MTVSELQGAAELQARETVKQTVNRWEMAGIPAQAVAPLMLQELLVQVLTQTLMLAHIGVVVGAIAPDPPSAPVEEPVEPSRIIMGH